MDSENIENEEFEKSDAEEFAESMEIHNRLKSANPGDRQPKKSHPATSLCSIQIKKNNY